MSFLKGLQPTPKLGYFHFGKQTEISSGVNAREPDSANTKTNREHGSVGWIETHCGEQNPTKPELRALHQLSVGLSNLWVPVHKPRHKLCPAAPVSPTTPPWQR